MSTPFSEGQPWKHVRADAMETEAEAIGQALTALVGIDRMMDSLTQAQIAAIERVLRHEITIRRESAAKLRAA